MSYILEPESPRRSPRTIPIAIVLCLLAAAGLYLFGRATSSPAPTAPATDPAADRISWSQVGPWAVPTSPIHGPAQTADGLATGFSHDELGAALAAFNITYRLTSDAGPLVYETTARQQTYGGVAAAIAEIRGEPTGGAAPTQFFYKVLTGDPTSDSVLLSLAVNSTDADGGYLTAQRSLRWENGDWRMAVPMPAAQNVSSLPGYRPLGTPHV
jgi:hypothetical protein